MEHEYLKTVDKLSQQIHYHLDGLATLRKSYYIESRTDLEGLLVKLRYLVEDIDEVLGEEGYLEN